MKFELMSGRHSNAKGNFQVGAIIDSEGDLSKAFKLKFKRRHDLEGIAEKAAAAAPVTPPKKLAPVAKTAAPKVAPVAPKAEPKADDDAAPKAEDDETPAADDADDEEAAPAAPVASKFGEDVTASFPSAKAGGFAIYRAKDGTFNLVDPSEPEEAVNNKPLKDVAAVNKLVGKLTD